jgi:RND family efflux transporter MFP subunit
MLLSLVLAGCGPSSKDTKSSESAAVRVAITVERPKDAKALTQTIEQPGKVTAQEQTGLYAKIAGYISEVKKDIGDTVGDDEPVIILALPELESECKQKEAAVKAAEARLTQAKRAEDVAKARIDEYMELCEQAKFSLARWEKEYARFSDLASSKNGVLDTQTKIEAEHQRDSAKSAVKAAEARVKSAKAEQEKAAADIEAANAQVKLDEADLKRVESLLAYRNVKAPFAGVVVERNADKGHFAAPQATGTKNQPLLVIVKNGPPRIFLNIPEADAPWIKDKAPATVRFGGRELKGKVIRIAGALEPKERTLLTEIRLDDDKAVLPFGAYVHTSIQVTHKETRTLAAAAILVEKEQTFCYLVDDGKAVKTAIQTGLRSGNRVEVLQKLAGSGDKAAWRGWDGEEKVITPIPGNLKDGQEVDVTER